MMYHSTKNSELINGITVSVIYIYDESFDKEQKDLQVLKNKNSASQLITEHMYHSTKKSELINNFAKISASQLITEHI